MKHSIRRFLSMSLALVMAIGLLLTSLGALAEVADGTYTGVGTGRNGDVQVSVTFEGGKIAGVEVGEHGETPGICEPAIEKLPAAIVENQSVAVDVVTGATLTSNMVII